MTQPGARILLDSISDEGDRLTTMEVKCHRFVLAEFNTHRAFSRNSASSRAIPFPKMVERVKFDLATPLSWPAEQKGMSGGAEVADPELAADTWKDAAGLAIRLAQRLHDQGVHKSVCNRLLEPFLWHTIIVSSTEWENFFAQRCSPLAQPEIQAVAYAMRDALNESKPKLVLDWHMPLITDEDWVDVQERFGSKNRENLYPILKRLSVARCARVSYLTHEGKRDISEDIAMYERLRSATPPHASPFEHVATPADADYEANGFPYGNFTGWHQHRHEVFDPE